MGRRKQRRVTAHRGVKLLERTHDSGVTAWVARWREPRTGKARQVSLDKLGLSTREARRAWAIRKARVLNAERAAIATGADLTESAPIAEAVAEYLGSAEVRLRPATVKTYKAAVSRFETWADSDGVVLTTDLTPRSLASLRDTLIRAPKRRAMQGKRRGSYGATRATRSPVSVNTELRAIATMLNEWRRRELVTLTSDQIRDGLRRLPESRPLPVFLSPAKLRRLLAATVRYDAETFAETRAEHRGDGDPGSTPRYTPIAPFAAFLLLTGCRRGEALTLLWSDVDLDALDASGERVGELRLRPEVVKTRHARVVGLEVSPALRKLLSALKLASGGHGRVFDPLTGPAVKKARHRLMKHYGAPDFTWQALRSTCATYLVNAPGIYGAASAFLAARQLGHSVVVAEKRYAGQLRGIRREARSLDAAMQIGDPLAEVLDSVASPASERLVAL